MAHLIFITAFVITGRLAVACVCAFAGDLVTELIFFASDAVAYGRIRLTVAIYARIARRTGWVAGFVLWIIAVSTVTTVTTVTAVSAITAVVCVGTCLVNAELIGFTFSARAV